MVARLLALVSRDGTAGWVEGCWVAEEPPPTCQPGTEKLKSGPREPRPPSHKPWLVSVHTRTRWGRDDSAMLNPQLPLLGLLHSVGAGRGLPAHLVLRFPRWAPWGTPGIISPTAHQGPGL